MAPSILMKETFSAATAAAPISERAKHVSAVFIRVCNTNYHFPARSLLSGTRRKSLTSFLRRMSRKWAFSLAEARTASILFGPHFGGIAQLVKRVVRNDEAWGSNPHTSTFK